MNTEFNENPFLKDTPVVPFSNGSEFTNWHNNNCASCLKYENKSNNEEEANCKLAFHIDMGSFLGNIPLWVAKGIGCDYNALYQTCELRSPCIQMRKGDDPF